MKKGIDYAPYKLVKKRKCPNCGQMRFVPFYNYDTGEVIEGTGRCDRVDSCGYFKHWMEGGVSISKINKQLIQLSLLTSFSITKVYSWEKYRKFNSLFNYMKNKYPYYLTEIIKAWETYHLGNSFAYTVFPYIKNELVFTTAKMIKYDESGKRIKDKEYIYKNGQEERSIDWIPFGYHLLKKHPEADVFIHEGVKNPLYAEFVDRAQKKPQRIHLATGSRELFQTINNIKDELKNRNVYTIPDKGCMAYWKEKFKIQTTFLDLLENEPRLMPGDDYVDYLILKKIL